MSETFTKLQNLMSAVLDVPVASIRSDTKADDLENWDSLGQMKLMLSIEEEFGIGFSPEQITQLLSVPDILNALSEAQG